jgi:hypothetical protein
MLRLRKSIPVAIVLIAVAGCADGGISGVAGMSSGRGSLAAGLTSAGSGADVAGDWQWSQELVLILPAWAAQGIFGIQPEGPTTYSRCSATGAMTLSQTGSTFTGTSQATSGQCVTKGGQIFLGVAPAQPQPIVGGMIRGRSLQMHRIGAGGSVDCTSHGVITEVQDGEATALKGGGPCIVPGHPKSNVPLDPPPGGVQTVLTWTAVRP